MIMITAFLVISLLHLRINCQAFNVVSLILNKCRVHPSVNSPSEYYGSSTPIHLELVPERFLEINDVSESFAMKFGFKVRWNVSCVAKLMNDAEWLDNAPLVYTNLNPEEFWQPSLVHINSLEDNLLTDSSFSKSLMVFIPVGAFIHVTVGLFSSYCELDFYQFPFDQQNCSIVFSLIYLTDVAEITTAVADPAKFFNYNFMPENTVWKFLQVSTNFTKAMSSVVPNKTISEATFTFTFKRKPEYYLVNLFTPSIALSILEVVSFFIPGDTGERPAFTITVLLSVMVMQVNFTFFCRTAMKIMNTIIF